MRERERLELSIEQALRKTFAGQPFPWIVNFEDLGFKRCVCNDAQLHEAIHEAATMLMNRRNQ